MGYTLTIGNATPWHRVEGLESGWTVAGMTREEAPVFPHDEMTGNSNRRSPSYTAWAEFSREAGIHDVFFDQWRGLLIQHPGCSLLRREHMQRFDAAVEPLRSIDDRPPGFEGWNGEDAGIYN